MLDQITGRLKGLVNCLLMQSGEYWCELDSHFLPTEKFDYELLGKFIVSIRVS